MSFISQQINGQKTAEDVLVLLRLNGVACACIPQNGSFVLTHNKTKEEFHQLMVDLRDFLGLKSQCAGWFPGSPGNELDNDGSDDSDYGYYVCPIEFVDGDYEDLTKFEYDFDMLISTHEVTWC